MQELTKLLEAVPEPWLVKLMVLWLPSVTSESTVRQ